MKAIVTEFMTEGSVEDFLKKQSKQSMTPLEILSIAIDAATGMRYLHENDIVHRDLAARNLLLTLENNKKIVKVSDFGLSRKISPENEEKNDYYMISTSKNPIRWTAPECFIQKHASIRSDLWSFGVVLYELFMFCQIYPYEDLSDIAVIKKIEEKENMYPYLQILDCPQDIQILLNKCLNNNPHLRPVFDTIILNLKKIMEQVKFNNVWSDLSVLVYNKVNDSSSLSVQGYVNQISDDFEVLTKNNIQVQNKNLSVPIEPILTLKEWQNEEMGKEEKKLTDSLLPLFKQQKEQHKQNSPINAFEIQPQLLLKFSDLVFPKPGFPTDHELELVRKEKKDILITATNYLPSIINYKPEVSTSGIAKSVTSENDYMPSRIDYKPEEKDTSQFDKEAKEFLEKAKKGEARGQCKIGHCYYHGTNGVPQDYQSAAFWYEKSANNGNLEAQNSLGNSYKKEGRGVVQDIKTALYWFHQAANQGYAPAQFNLGFCYQEMAGQCQEPQKTENYKQAVFWYGKATERKHSEAAFYLGLLHEKGWGVSLNATIAMECYIKAKNLGFTKAQERIDKLNLTLNVKSPSMKK